MNAKKLKLAAATAGATGVLAMGALTVAFSGTSVADPAAPGPIATPEATTGATTKASTANAEPETSVATPSITGPAPLPPEEEGLPG